MYKRYASLYFVMGIDASENELITLEVIHHYVEVLDKYFGNVCELDLIFNFHKAGSPVSAIHRLVVHKQAPGPCPPGWPRSTPRSSSSALRRPSASRSLGTTLYPCKLIHLHQLAGGRWWSVRRTRRLLQEALGQQSLLLLFLLGGGFMPAWGPGAGACTCTTSMSACLVGSCEGLVC